MWRFLNAGGMGLAVFGLLYFGFVVWLYGFDHHPIFYIGVALAVAGGALCLSDLIEVRRLYPRVRYLVRVTDWGELGDVPQEAFYEYRWHWLALCRFKREARDNRFGWVALKRVEYWPDSEYVDTVLQCRLNTGEGKPLHKNCRCTILDPLTDVDPELEHPQHGDGCNGGPV